MTRGKVVRGERPREGSQGWKNVRGRLREHLWVWLQLQDEKAKELVPRQVQVSLG